VGNSVAVPVGGQHQLLGQPLEVRDFPLLADVTDLLKRRDPEPGCGQRGEVIGDRPAVVEVAEADAG
jgi:hypothetical protein